MYTKKYILYIRKKTSNIHDSISHKLMLKSGLIRKISSGLYIWLPNGLRIIKNIKKIIRYEMNKNGAIELIFPIMQPENIWHKSNRFYKYGKELIKIYDRNNHCFILSPTYEEMFTNFIKQEIKSYKDLPIILYQIQSKFRDEIRPRSGIMRSKEFLMKDAYSFHTNKKCLKNTYHIMYKTYLKIFNKLKLCFYSIQADSGLIGGKYSHEFQCLSPNGEDKFIILNNKKYKNINLIHSIKKIYKINNKDQYNNKNKKITNSIEIGHIFNIGTKYSKIINTKIKNSSGIEKFTYMGCYGIGITRLISAIIEQNHDEKGIIWPIHISPFHVLIIPIYFHKCYKIRYITKKLEYKFKKNNITVLIDNRNKSTGTIFSDSNLIGIPNIIIINKYTIQKKYIEYQNRKNISKKKFIHINKIVMIIKNKIQKL